MSRLTTLAAVTLTALAAFVQIDSAAFAGCHGGFCGPGFYGQSYYGGFDYGYGCNIGYGYDYNQYSTYFSQFSVQERLILVKRFPQFEKAIFPNGIPTNGAVATPALTGAAAAVVAPGAANVVAPAVGGAVAPAGGPAPAVGAPIAAPAVAPAAGGAVVPPAPAGAALAPAAAGPAAAVAAAANPANVPVRPELAPIAGNTPR